MRLICCNKNTNAISETISFLNCDSLGQCISLSVSEKDCLLTDLKLSAKIVRFKN